MRSMRPLLVRHAPFFAACAPRSTGPSRLFSTVYDAALSSILRSLCGPVCHTQYIRLASHGPLSRSAPKWFAERPMSSLSSRFAFLFTASSPRCTGAFLCFVASLGLASSRCVFLCFFSFIRFELHDLYGLLSRLRCGWLTARPTRAWPVWVMPSFVFSAPSSSDVSCSFVAASLAAFGVAALGFIGDFSHTLALGGIPRASSFGLGARERGLRCPPNISFF